MIYSLGGKTPQLRGNNYIAPSASVIGDVVLGRNANVWWNVVIRGDNDTITIGDRNSTAPPRAPSAPTVPAPFIQRSSILGRVAAISSVHG